MQTIIEVNDNNFKKNVLEMSKKVPVVVDFWAQWCGPCLMLGPSLENLAKQYNGKFILAKLNVDNSPNISRVFMIRGIPAVKMFRNEKIKDEFIGVLPEAQVKKWLDKNLK